MTTRLRFTSNFTEINDEIDNDTLNIAQVEARLEMTLQ